MSQKPDVFLTQDGVRVLGSGQSPELDIEGGNHWNLADSDGDVRIGDDQNMLKMGVALDGGGAGNANVWATSDLKLGSGGESVVSIDDGNLTLTGDAGSFAGRAIVEELSVSSGAFTDEQLDLAGFPPDG